MTEVVTEGQVGPQVLADGVSAPFRQGKTAEAIVQELHGRFCETNYRNALFGGGMGLTAINNATFTSATTGATATPIAGVWNPSTSPVNLVILQAVLGITMSALAATGGGPYVWMASVGNTAISTGNSPTNRKTLVKSGSYAKDLSGVAVTGITNALAVLFGSSLFGGSAESVSFTATAVAMQTQQASAVENIDGGIIVPPGGLLALMATTTPVAHSAVSALMWEEVAV